MPAGVQAQMFGKRPVVQGTIADKVEHVLRHHQDARNDYKALVFHYWVEIDGLNENDLSDLDALRDFMVNHATSAKTLQNRAMEIQHRRPELDAVDDVREWRDAQAHAGPVGV